MTEKVNQTIKVVKLTPERKEMWHYSATVLQQQGSTIFLEAAFNAPDMDVQGVLLETGDRFLEAYYTDRWYNIYEAHSKVDDHLKGYYCNISLPAEWVDGELHFVDLALDLLVYPDGTQRVLDEDEFAALNISSEVRASARRALVDLQELFTYHHDEIFQMNQ